MTPRIGGTIKIDWSISFPDGAELASGTAKQRSRLLDFVEDALKSAIDQEVKLVTTHGDDYPFYVNFDLGYLATEIEIVEGPVTGELETLRDELDP
jgi:hypothetical protein